MELVVHHNVLDSRDLTASKCSSNNFLEYFDEAEEINPCKNLYYVHSQQFSSYYLNKCTVSIAKYEHTRLDIFKAVFKYEL